MQILEDLRQFHEFVGSQLQASATLMTPEQCLEVWRGRHPSVRDLAESRADVQAAIEEMAQGDVGNSARESVMQLREAHRLAKTP